MHPQGIGTRPSEGTRGQGPRPDTLATRREADEDVRGRRFLAVLFNLLAITGAFVLTGPSGTVAWADPTDTTTAPMQADTPPPAIDPADRSTIEATNDPAELVQLARRLTIRRRKAAAQMAIAKACDLDPSLLGDDKRASPRSWRNLWFGYRAELRADRLAPDDAAGWVALATWLSDAGLGREARTMLRSALKIDPTLPEARALADAWYLFGGGPFQFDLTFAAIDGLFPDSLDDEGEALTPPRSRQWMFLPFAYRPDEESIDIQHTMLQVIADDRYRCRVLGMVLLVTAQDRTSRSAAESPPLPGVGLQPPSEPIWERLRIDRDASGEVRILAYNITSPRSRRQGSSAGARSARTGVEIDPASGRVSGYAAFVLEIPETAQQLDVVFRDEIGLSLDVPQLRLLSTETDGIPPAARSQHVESLCELSGDSNSGVASAAAAKLGMIRWDLSQQPQAPTDREPSTGAQAVGDSARIEQALSTAAVHPNKQVRQTAFRALIDTPSLLSQPLLSALASAEEPQRLLTLLDQTEQILASADETSGASAGAGWIPDQITDFTELEAAPVAGNVFLLLSACLRSQHDEVVARALNILLADGSRQSALVLMEAPASVRSMLIDRLADLEEGTFKSALFGVIAAEADPDMLARLLDACRDLELEIHGPDNAVLMLLRRPLPPAVQARVVHLLARSDLSKVLDAKMAKQVWMPLANHACQNTTLAKAVLELAQRHYDDRAIAPIPREIRSPARGGQASPDTADTFTNVLAVLATGFKAAPETALDAARLLLTGGHTELLRDRLEGALASGDLAHFIKAVTRDASIDDNETLAVLLAGFVEAENTEVAAAALVGLGQLYQKVDDDARHGLNLLVKLHLRAERLGELSLETDEQLAREAGSLLRVLGHLTADEWNMLQGKTEPHARREAVATLNRARASQPAGLYMCRLYADLERPPETPQAADSRDSHGWTARLRPAPAATAFEWEGPFENVLWEADEVRIAPAGETGFQITCAGRSIAPHDAPAGVVEITRSGQLPIDVPVVLRSALDRAEKERHLLAPHVDRGFLIRPLRGELAHVQLGTWAASLSSIPQASEADPHRPIRIRAVRLFLEPIALDHPKP